MMLNIYQFWLRKLTKRKRSGISQKKEFKVRLIGRMD